MEMIAGLFWIIYGLLFILYQYFASIKHSRSQAIVSVAFVVLSVSGLIAVSIVTKSAGFALFSLLLFLMYRYKANAKKAWDSSLTNKEELLKISDNANRMWSDVAPFIWAFSIAFLSFNSVDILNTGDISIAVILAFLPLWVVAFYRSRDKL